MSNDLEKRVEKLEQKTSGCAGVFGSLLKLWLFATILGPFFIWISVVGEPLLRWQWKQMTPEQKDEAFDSEVRERQDWIREKLWGDKYK